MDMAIHGIVKSEGMWHKLIPCPLPLFSLAMQRRGTMLPAASKLPFAISRGHGALSPAVQRCADMSAYDRQQAEKGMRRASGRVRL
jgi:hypothetical protein